jgi:hypothetical protein
VAERNDFELQFCASEKPTSELGGERRKECHHAGDTMADHRKSLHFKMLSEFSVATGLSGLFHK